MIRWNQPETKYRLFPKFARAAGIARGILFLQERNICVRHTRMTNARNTIQNEVLNS